MIGIMLKVTTEKTVKPKINVHDLDRRQFPVQIMGHSGSR